MDSSSTKTSETSANSSYPEIGKFSTYLYLIMASIQIIFQIFATIIYCLELSWWYFPILILTGVGTYFAVIFFRLRKEFLRFTSMGLAFLSFIILLLPPDSILPLWTIFTVIIAGILIFIQNYRDTRFPFMRHRR